MNRIITFVAIILATVAPQAGARLIKVINTSTLEQVPDTTSIAPRRTVELLDDGVRVTYHFDNIAIVTAKRPGVTFKLEDSERGFPFGFPDLPALCDRIEVPIGGVCSLALESVEFNELPIEVAPSYPLTNLFKPVNPDMPIQDRFVPDCDSVVTIPGYSYDMNGVIGCKTCRLKIVPVVYNSGRQIARIAKSISYKLKFDASALEEQRAKGHYLYSSPDALNCVRRSPEPKKERPNDTLGTNRQRYFIHSKHEDMCQQLKTGKRRKDWKIDL